MFLITRFAKLMDGFTCMFEVFIDVCYVSGSRMMILGPIVNSIDVNGVFKLLGDNTSMEPIDCMGMLTFDH
jgi:hypothetical protein